MSAKMNSFIYPYTEQVKNLPVFLTGIGCTEYQGYTRRTGESCCWEQIMYCTGGSGCLEYDGKTFDINSGDIFYIPRVRTYEYFPCKKKWEVRWIVFDGSDIEGLMKALGMDLPTVVHAEDLSVFQKLFDKIFITLKTDKIYGNYLCSELTYQFIMELRRLMFKTSVSDGSTQNKILMPALNYIEENFKKDFSIVELAADCGISQQYLRRIFRQTMNVSPTEYIIDRRIREATRLLTDTDKSISEISQLCGFSSVVYFCAVFKKSKGCSPGSYRSSNKYLNIKGKNLQDLSKLLKAKTKAK